MTEHPFDNDATPGERKEVVENDKRVADERRASTYHQHAINEANEAGGRFRIVNETIVIDGAMPKYPVGNEWCAGDQGLEPPLGVSINAAPEPVGTAKEVQQSLERLGEIGIGSGSPDGGAAAAPASGLSSLAEAVEPAAPLSTFIDDDEPPRAA
jgi:hypothetical protein